ncbi:MAG: hypothetical protein ACE5K8_07485 [Candidatus Zixiibacteriota bacterium]
MDKTTGEEALRKVIGRVLIALVIPAGISAGWGCTENNKGEDKNVYKRIESAVQELDLDNSEAIDSLALEIRERSLKDPRKVVDILHSGENKDAEKAAAILLELGDLALAPLLEKVDLSDPESTVWEMKLAVDIHLANRARVVKLLEEMLEDTTMVEPGVSLVHVEEAPVPKRVCDEAYLMMRVLFALEDEETRLMNTDAFLDLSDEERDAEIKRARESGKWSSLVDQAYEEDKTY